MEAAAAAAVAAVAADAVEAAEMVRRIDDILSGRGERAATDKPAGDRQQRRGQQSESLAPILPDAYLVTNPAGVIVEADARAAEILNRRRDALRGKSLARLIELADRARFRADVRSLRSGAPLRRFQWRLRPRHRSAIDSEMTASIVRDDGGSVTFVRWLIRDVTRIIAGEQQLLDYQRRLRALAAEVSMAEERERRQIAVEIHDRISQNLAMAKLRLASIRSQVKSTSDPRVDFEFYDALFLLEQTIEDTRTLTFELSPPILYELGLLPAVQWLAEELSRRHGIKVAVAGTMSAGAGLGEDIRSLLFRSVRELLINVIKHAQATAARVSVRALNGRVRVTVADDGQGFTAAGATPDGFGLFSMRTRLEEMGGKVEISSVPNTGTRVTLFAPIDMSDSGGGSEHGHENLAGG